MSQFTRSGRQVRDPQMLSDIEKLNKAIKKTLSSTYLLLFYNEDQRPGSMHILSDSIQLTVDQRNALRVSYFVRY